MKLRSLRRQSMRFSLLFSLTHQIFSVYRSFQPWMKDGSHSSLPIPKSLQQRISAVDLEDSTAVASPMPYEMVWSPIACDTNLPFTYMAYSRMTVLPRRSGLPRGTMAQPPWPKVRLRMRLPGNERHVAGEM